MSKEHAMTRSDLWQLVKDTGRAWSEDKVPRLAAALSYYSLFSLAPMLIIIIGVAGLVFGRDAAEGRVVEEFEGLLGHEGAQVVQSMIAKTGSTGSNLVATIVGVVTLLVGATGVFAQLQDALNTIWGVTLPPGRGFLHAIRTRVFSFGVVLGIGFLLLISLVISALLTAFGHVLNGRMPGASVLLQVLNFVVSVGVITLLFALIYKLLPDANVLWRDVWFGAAVTALLFTVGKFLIGLYLGKSSAASAFGAAGSVVIVLIWVYYSSLILFLGAEFTQVHASSRGRSLTNEPQDPRARHATRVASPAG
jgi:membrane protein